MAENYDGYINIGTKVNTDGIKEGVQEVNTEIKKTGKKTNLAAIGALGAAVTGVTAAFSATSAAVQKVNSAIKDSIQTYKNDVKAEKQLQMAAKNNPYLNGDSVTSLQDYANHLQDISTYGAGDLLPFMAELASAGRTESEIMDIMTASIDMAASGSISLQSAVQGLNQSYSGQVGQLGKLVPQLKTMTTEQLRSGAAVEAIKKNYAGTSEEITKATGSSEQLANAWSDLKSAIGAGFNFLFAPAEKFFTWAIGRATELIKKFNDLAGFSTENTSAKASDLAKTELSNLEKQQAEQKKILEDTKRERSEREKALEKAGKLAEETERQAQAEKAHAEYLEVVQQYQDSINRSKAAELENDKKILANNAKIKELQDTALADYNAGKIDAGELEARRKEWQSIEKENKQLEAANKKIEKAIKKDQDLLDSAAGLDADVNTGTFSVLDKKAADTQAKIDNLDAQIADKKKEVARLKAEEDAGAASNLSDAVIQNQSNLDKTLANIDAEAEARRSLGLYVDEEAVAQEKLNAELESYIALMQTGENIPESFREKRIQQIKDEAEATGDASVGYNQLKSAVEELTDTSYKETVAALEIQKQELQALVDTGTLTEDQLKDVKKALDAVTYQIFAAKLEPVKKVLDKVNEYTDQYADIVSNAVSLFEDQVDTEEEYKLKKLKKQYNEGLISEEEYNSEKEKIEKESAEKTYQLEMWNWSTQCLQAVASGALAVVNALSTAGNIYAGIAMAAVATAMTGIQLGTLMAAKPIKPSFATGGIVPGTSYTGDNVQANVNSGEMILNAQQQAQLWKMANGSSSGSGAVLNMPISITNEVSDQASVDVEKELNQIKIMVRKQVQDDIGNGLYNSQLMKAQGTFKGVRYTN